MKRGVIFNLIVIGLLVFLILLPLMIFAITESAARANGCSLEGPDWGEGVCQELYSLAFVGGLVGSVTSPIFAVVLGLYLLGGAIFFLASLIRARSAGQPVWPPARGVMISSLVLVGLAGVAGLGLLAYRWYTTAFISACQGLPASAAGRAQNGPLAIGVRLPYPAGRPESYVIQITSPQGEPLATLKDLPASRDPAWSPDGKQLAYVAQPTPGQRWGVYLTGASGGETRPALEGDLEIQSPAFSPDGRTLLFQRWREPSASPDTLLYALDLERNSLRPLADSQGFDGGGRFSPDGKQIVFVSKRNGWGDIYVMQADGSNLRRLTYHNLDDIDPAWSPDGRWIVFASSRAQSGVYDLYIMAADGSNQCRLTQGEGTEWRPAWSPDGAWIAYIAWSENRVYQVRPNGTEATPLPLPAEITPLSLDWARQP